MKQQQLHKTNNTAELATGICHGALHDKVAKGGEGRAPPGTKGKCRGQVGCCHPSCPANLTAVLQENYEFEFVGLSQQNYLAADQHWSVQQRRKKIVQPRWLRRLQPGRETSGSSKLQR